MRKNILALLSLSIFALEAFAEISAKPLPGNAAATAHNLRQIQAFVEASAKSRGSNVLTAEQDLTGMENGSANARRIMQEMNWDEAQFSKARLSPSPRVIAYKNSEGKDAYTTIEGLFDQLNQCQKQLSETARNK